MTVDMVGGHLYCLLPAEFEANLEIFSNLDVRPDQMKRVSLHMSSTHTCYIILSEIISQSCLSYVLCWEFQSLQCVNSLTTGGGRVVRRCWVNFQCWGVPLIWKIVGQGPIALAVGACGVVWTFFLSSIISLFVLPLSGSRPNID